MSFKVWSRFPNGNFVIERSFELEKFAVDLVRYRMSRDREIGDKREYIITVDGESPSDKANVDGVWSPESIY